MQVWHRGVEGEVQVQSAEAGRGQVEQVSEVRVDI